MKILHDLLLIRPTYIMEIKKIRHYFRFKDGTGDPIGFKNMLRLHNLPVGTFVRYVGNRMHVVFHLAGILVLHWSKLKDFILMQCTAGEYCLLWFDFSLTGFIHVGLCRSLAIWTGMQRLKVFVFFFGHKPSLHVQDLSFRYLET